MHLACFGPVPSRPSCLTHHAHTAGRTHHRPHACTGPYSLALPLLLPLHSCCWDNMTVGYRSNGAQVADQGRVIKVHALRGRGTDCIPRMAASALRTLHTPALHASRSQARGGAFSPSQPLILSSTTRRLPVLSRHLLRLHGPRQFYRMKDTVTLEEEVVSGPD